MLHVSLERLESFSVAMQKDRDLNLQQPGPGLAEYSMFIRRILGKLLKSELSKVISYRTEALQVKYLAIDQIDRTLSPQILTTVCMDTHPLR